MPLITRDDELVSRHDDDAPLPLIRRHVSRKHAVLVEATQHDTCP